MASDVENGLRSYYLSIDKSKKEDLSILRNWNTLKVASEGDKIWLTNFTADQIKAVEVKIIPKKEIYYSKNGKLYPLNSLLPSGNEPSLLWTPIQRAFPIKIKKFNHNYFGVNEKISIRFIKEENSKKAYVMYISIEEMYEYAKTAPAVRLEKLYWVVVNKTHVLLFGTPVLPIPGDMFWKKDDLIIPVGFNFELPLLSNLVNQQINSDNDYWIIWNPDCTYYKVEKNQLKLLTLASVRKTMSYYDNNSEQ